MASSYDPAWRNTLGAGCDQADRQGAERRPRRLARGLGAVPRRRRLRLARRAACRRRWPRAWRPAALPSARRSSGRRSGWCSRRGDYHWQHEPCWYAVREKGKGHWTGDRKQTTLWQIPSRDQDAATVHGTQKPVECMRRPMLNNSAPGPAGLRSLPRLRHQRDRRRDDRPRLPRAGARSGLRRCHRRRAGRRSPAGRPGSTGAGLTLRGSPASARHREAQEA